MKLPIESRVKFLTFLQININTFGEMQLYALSSTLALPFICRDPEIKPISISHLTKSTRPHHHSMLNTNDVIEYI